MSKSRKSSPKPKKAAKAPARKAAAAAPAEPGRETKLNRLEALLRRPEGVTVSDLAKQLDWQPHSVRGAMSGALKKKLGLKLTSEKTKGAERVYRIER